MIVGGRAGVQLALNGLSDVGVIHLTIGH